MIKKDNTKKSSDNIKESGNNEESVIKDNSEPQNESLKTDNEKLYEWENIKENGESKVEWTNNWIDKINKYFHEIKQLLLQSRNRKSIQNYLEMKKYISKWIQNFTWMKI